MDTPTARTVTLYVTGHFGDWTDEQVADYIYEILSDDPVFFGPQGENPIVGISLPSEEATEED